MLDIRHFVQAALPIGSDQLIYHSHLLSFLCQFLSFPVCGPFRWPPAHLVDTPRLCLMFCLCSFQYWPRYFMVLLVYIRICSISVFSYVTLFLPFLSTSFNFFPSDRIPVGWYGSLLLFLLLRLLSDPQNQAK